MAVHGRTGLLTGFAATVLCATTGCSELWRAASELLVETPDVAPVAAASFRLSPVSIPAPAADVHDAVLFLPLINRSEWAIHPAWLRAFDRTLAAHAAVFDGLRVIDPDVAGAIAEEIGFPDPWSWQTGSEFAPSAESLAKRGRAAGAATVVWGEILADHRVRLYATGDASDRWSGISVALEGPRDLAVYEGPRLVLEAVRGAPVTPEDAPTEAHQVLETILAEIAHKDPATLRRAEQSLARLAVRYPHWPEPWIELASIRPLRALAINDFYSNLIAEGPSPARHVARLFSSLSDEADARLDAIDLLLTLSSRSIADRRTLNERLPDQAWERVALAWQLDRGKEFYSLDRIEPRSTDERAMLDLLGAPHADEGQARILSLAESVEPRELVAATFLLSSLAAFGDQEGDWTLYRTTSRTQAASDAMAILELLRGECMDLASQARRECEEPVAAVLAAAGVGASPEVFADAAAWRGTLLEWRNASLQRTGGSSLVTLPQAKIFQEDPAFVSEWILPAELVLAANAVLPLASAARGGLADAPSLLIAPTRLRLTHRIDRMLDAQQVPALIQARRGDVKASGRYSTWSRRFVGFPVVDYWQAYFGQLSNELEAAAAVYERLAKRDPYDHRWRQPWLHWVDYRENISWDDSSSEAAARWLETLVPRPAFLTREIARAWGDADRHEVAIERYAEMEELIEEPFARVVQDGHLAALGRPVEERIERIEEALRHVSAYDGDYVKKLAELETLAGRFARAEQRVRDLATRRSMDQWACSRLVDLAAWQGRAEEGGEVLVGCAERAQDHWAAARAWVRYANGLVDRDRYEEAAEAYQTAYAQIGGAGDVVGGMGRLAELSGDYEAARAQYEFLRDRYGGGDESDQMGRWELWQLYMRQDRTDEALAEVEKLVMHGWGNQHLWSRLLKTYAVRGELEAFETLARERLAKRFEQGPAYALAKLQAGRGEVDEAVALVERIAGSLPNQPFWPAYAAEFLIEAGRGAEAVELARRAFEADPEDTWSAGVYVDALVAAGRLGEAEEHARALAALRSNWWANWEPLARVEKARGRSEAVRALIERLRQRHPWGSNPWSAEAEWLPLEVSLGLPAPESRAMQQLSERVDRALARHPLDSELWEAQAAIRRHMDDLEGARVAAARAARLSGREAAGQEVAVGAIAR